MEKYILASSSPRRKQILTDMGILFNIQLPDYDEDIINKTFSYELIKNTAQKKGESVIKKVNSGSIVISADTVVVNDNKILGKPKDFDEACAMLKQLSGKTHKVVTAVCIIDSRTNKQYTQAETSEVTFNKISENEIKRYITEYKPFDKAGSYGIQELPENFIKNVQGEYDNIVGLPSKMLSKMLSDITSRKV
ncbi:MAG: Maf family protein [Candidatus Gastranaerophilales bacterium]|nr:Maf family protein [Candidatus Gastranaerophilales bacterium]